MRSNLNHGRGTNSDPEANPNRSELNQNLGPRFRRSSREDTSLLRRGESMNSGGQHRGGVANHSTFPPIYTRKERTVRVWTIWFFIILIILAMIFFIFYFRRVVTKDEGSSENKFDLLEQKIDELNSNLNKVLVTVDFLEEKANHTITNYELLQQVNDQKQKVETLLLVTQKQIRDELDKTQSTIEANMRVTAERLNKTVEIAHESIKNDLDMVQASVDKYETVTSEQLASAHDFMIYQLSGMFTLICCLISLFHVSSHLRHFNKPVVQRKILAILWMPPVYAVSSWLSLVFPPMASLFEIFRSSYEAYTIYMFISLMISIIGNGDIGEIVDLLHSKAYDPPCTCCGKFLGARSAFFQLQLFGVQYVALMPLTSILQFIFEFYGYKGAWWDYKLPFFYLNMISNISVSFALYAMFKFYHAFRTELAWCNPWPKFLCIKGVIFMTFYQGLTLSILANFGFVATGTSGVAQHFIICIEMFLAALVHPFVFGHDEWQDGYEPIKNTMTFAEGLAFQDFLKDVKRLIKSRNVDKTEKNKEVDALEMMVNKLNVTEDDYVTEEDSSSSSSTEIEPNEKSKKELKKKKVSL